jgi:hypothetical protein
MSFTAKLDTQKEENENLQKLIEIILKQYLHKFLLEYTKILMIYEQSNSYLIAHFMNNQLNIIYNIFL